MFNSMKVTAFILSLTFFGSIATNAAEAIKTSTSQQYLVKENISDTELARFATAYEHLKSINIQIQEKMLDLVVEEGLDMDRFNEIQQAILNPEVDVEATEEEKIQHRNVIIKLEAMQGMVEEKMQEIIPAYGLTTQRYEQIAKVLQKDLALQERLKKFTNS